MLLKLILWENTSKSTFNEEERKVFVQHLIEDIQALENTIKEGLVEDDIVRIGAEQEMCLINQDYRPAAKSLDIIKTLDDSHCTTELASYNLEANLDPYKLEKDCFSSMELQLKGLLQKVKKLQRSTMPG